jgi:hypothetical protein
MSTVVDLSEQELAELKALTRQTDAAAAVRTAMAEYVRYVRRQRLKELSGQVQMEDTARGRLAEGIDRERLDRQDAVEEAAMIELTEQQRGELEKRQPVEVRDPKTNEVYVLLRKDVYEGVLRIVREVNERADWDDPALDVYDRDVT